MDAYGTHLYMDTYSDIHTCTRTVRANTARPNMHSQADSVPECVPSERREFGPSARKEHLFPLSKRRVYQLTFSLTSVHQVGGRWHRSELESLLSLLHERPESEPQEARYDQRRRRRLGAARAHTRAYKKCQSAGRGYGTWGRARASASFVRVRVRSVRSAVRCVCVCFGVCNKVGTGLCLCVRISVCMCAGTHARTTHAHSHMI